MKHYIICALLFFCTSIQAEKNSYTFNIPSDIGSATSDIDDLKIIDDAFKQFQKEQEDANNNPEHAATWQAMLKDLDHKKTNQLKLIDKNDQLRAFVQECAKNPEQMPHANKELVTTLQENNVQQFILFFVGTPTAFSAGIPIAMVNPALITHNSPAQKLALRELLTSCLGDAIRVNKKITYTSDTLNIRASLHAADALSGLTVYALESYRSPEARTLQCASASVASALIKYSLKPVETKTVIGNNHILVLSNGNILSAVTNTAEQTIQQLPKHSMPSASALARTFGIHIALEINYNIMAQLLRTTTTPILDKIVQFMNLPPETSKGIINTYIPEDYEPHDYVQHMVKWGINCTTSVAAYYAYTTIAHALTTLSTACKLGSIQL